MARGGQETHQAGVRPLLEWAVLRGLGSAHLRHFCSHLPACSHLLPVGRSWFGQKGLSGPEGGVTPASTLEQVQSPWN